MSKSEEEETLIELEHELETLPTNQTAYKKMLTKQNLKETMISLSALLVFGLILSSILATGMTLYLGASFMSWLLVFLPFSSIVILPALPMHSNFGLKDYLYKKLSLHDNYNVNIITQDNSITVQLIQQKVEKFYDQEKEYLFNDLSSLQKFLMAKQSMKRDGHMKYTMEYNIVEEKKYQIEEDIDAIEYTAELKAKAESLNNQYLDNCQVEIKKNVEQAKILGIPRIEGIRKEEVTQDAKMLGQTLKELVKG